MNFHTKPEDQKVSLLNKLVGEALDSFDGDVKKAAASLTKRLMRDKSSLEEVLGEVVYNAAQHLTNIKNLSTRALVCRGADTLMREKASEDWNGSQVVDRIVSARGGLMNFPLAGGMKLADATTKEIIVQRDDYRVRGQDMERKAAFLSAVAKKLPDGKKTKSILSENDLQKLWEKTSNEVAA